MTKLRIVSPFERPLAITQPKLQQIAEVWLRHQAGQKIDFASLDALVEKKPAKQTGGHGYVVQDGVAIIDVEGVLGKGMNLFMWFSGGTSTELLQNDLADAIANDSVHSIVLRVDSPGGDVDGTQLFADAVAAAGQKKPVVAWVTGLGASAAYWISSQAGKIILADETTWVGSIGVVAMHYDYSKADEQDGIKRTEITAGKYKRIASDTGPLTQDGRQTIQDQVDAIYAVFLQNVADGRDMTPDQVHEDMADGRLFMGQKAIDVGLADGIATLDQVLTQLNAEHDAKLQNPGASASTTHSTGERTMSEPTNTTYTQAQLDDAVAKATTQGATAERARIQGVLDQQIHAGHKDLIQTLAFDGKTTPAEAAMQINAAEKKALANAKADLEKDASATAPAAAADPAKEAKEQVDQQQAAAGAKQDTVITAAQINARIEQAKTQGRVLNVITAKNELEAEAAAKK